MDVLVQCSAWLPSWSENGCFNLLVSMRMTCVFGHKLPTRGYGHHWSRVLLTSSENGGWFVINTFTSSTGGQRWPWSRQWWQLVWIPSHHMRINILVGAAPVVHDLHEHGTFPFWSVLLFILNSCPQKFIGSLCWLGSFEKIGKISFVWDSLCSPRDLLKSKLVVAQRMTKQAFLSCSWLTEQLS